MTQEEKDQMNQKRMERLKKENKSRIKYAIILPVAGLILSGVIGFIGSGKQSEIKSATVLEDMSVGDFINDNAEGAAIYTGTIRAVDPVRLKGDDQNYILMGRQIEQEEKVYDDNGEDYKLETTPVSNKSKHCEEIQIDDVAVDYDLFHSLPKEEESDRQGNGDSRMITTYTYITDGVEGTYFIKCKDNKITSVEYYSGEDVAAQSSSMFGLVIVIIWLIVIAADIYLIVKYFSLKKVIKE